ncbi:hypothetical protein [Paracoccus benzoatiresistens]|uniref:Uncharacterized protein n=1 Tax=Paracoccus benzoatiresistens TaxID=2997341 RepID=A0ABT4J1M8_9RHOB|nr:hypothetical protein [Paracoccus sp. EF6]MCZ0961019.1 hypothetical protein [Paracoccus sp. EF6]
MEPPLRMQGFGQSGSLAGGDDSPQIVAQGRSPKGRPSVNHGVTRETIIHDGK